MLTSMQVAQLTGSFQEQHNNRMQYASMVGPQAGYGNFSEGLVGGAFNKAGAIGGPLTSAGAMLAGVDPVSMGLRVGMGASRMGAGFIGAGTAGLAAAGAAAVPLMAAQYTGGQIMAGAQGQQQLNTNLRSGFQFQNSAGGMGFSRGDMSDIGQTLRSMSTQQSSGGEMVSFGELGRLASNMGRMGMAQGVRDAKEFSEKFRSMVKSLKDIATDMGTSLEEAQKMMGAMRSSGVFGAGNSAGFSRSMRASAHAGGLALAEVSGMMNIGSQISRSIGGRGVAGARGGIETITNIGVAQQMGVLSEEDIYNATGLTGAEGRRALATQQMSSAASFLKGGLGRRFLASVAGKNGTLDESSVEEYMAGGVGTGRTMQMARRNLQGVGRANFVRNEGRLRGEALGQFGGLAPAMVMKGWLDQRGMDVNEDADRSMIFMQRRLGLGRDEADAMIKQVQALPQLLQQRRTAGEDDRFAAKMSLRQASTGIEGLKHKFEKSREDINASLQQVGATYYQSMSEMVEGYINRMTGNTVKEMHADVARAFESGMRGGVAGRSELGRSFGIGRSGSGLLGGGLSSSFRSGGNDLSQFRALDAESFSKAGYHLGGASSGSELQRGLELVGNVNTAFQTGGRGMQGHADVSALGAEAGEDIRRQMALGGARGRGIGRLNSFQGVLDNLSERGGKYSQLRERYASAGSEERAQIMAALTESAGVQGEASMFAAPTMKSVFGSSQFATVGEKNRAIGKFIYGTDGEGQTVRGLKNMFGGLFGKAGASEQQVEAAGRFFNSEEGRDLASRALSDDEGMRRDASKTVQQELTKLQQRDAEDLTEADKGRQEALRGVLFATELGPLEGTDKFDAKLEQLARESGMDKGKVLNLASGAGGAAAQMRTEGVMEVASRYGERAREANREMERGGLLTRGPGGLTINQDVMSSLKGIGSDGKGGSTAQQFLQGMLGQQGLLARTGVAGQSPEEAQRYMAMAGRAGEAGMGALADMSVADKRKLAEALRGVGGAGDLRSEVLAQSNLQDRLDRANSTGGRLGGARLGGVGSIAKMLGADLDPKSIRRMLETGQGAEGIAAAIGQDTGISAGGENMTRLREALIASQSGDTGTAAAELRNITGSKEFIDASKKKQLAKQEGENPLQAKANEYLQGMRDDMKEMKRMSGLQLSALTGIRDNTTAPSGEDKG